MINLLRIEFGELDLDPSKPLENNVELKKRQLRRIMRVKMLREE